MWRRTRTLWRRASKRTLLVVGAILWGVGFVVGWWLLVAIPKPPIGTLIGLVVISLGTICFREGLDRRKSE